jgi:hypothetical protein
MDITSEAPSSPWLPLSSEDWEHVFIDDLPIVVRLDSYYPRNGPSLNFQNKLRDTGPSYP